MLVVYVERPENAKPRPSDREFDGVPMMFHGHRSSKRSAITLAERTEEQFGRLARVFDTTRNVWVEPTQSESRHA
jgi:hypothetical protein